jgi:hypothetical protein
MACPDLQNSRRFDWHRYVFSWDRPVASGVEYSIHAHDSPSVALMIVHLNLSAVRSVFIREKQPTEDILTGSLHKHFKGHAMRHKCQHSALSLKQPLSNIAGEVPLNCNHGHLHNFAEENGPQQSWTLLDPAPTPSRRTRRFSSSKRRRRPDRGVQLRCDSTSAISCHRVAGGNFHRAQRYQSDHLQGP